MPAAVQLEACRTSTLYQMIQEAKETMEEDEEEEDAELPAPPTKKQRTRKGQHACTSKMSAATSLGQKLVATADGHAVTAP